MNNRTCSTCAHDGCCDGLPNCGGCRWKPAYGECAECGALVLLVDVEFEDEDGRIFCSEDCMDEYHADDEEQEADDGE